MMASLSMDVVWFRASGAMHNPKPWTASLISYLYSKFGLGCNPTQVNHNPQVWFRVWFRVQAVCLGLSHKSGLELRLPV
jgi:hypothetical protein